MIEEMSWSKQLLITVTETEQEQINAVMERARRLDNGE